MTDKEAQLKAKLLKMKLAESDYQTRNRLDKAKSPMSKEVPFGKDKRKKSEIRDDVLDKTISEAKGTKIRPKTPTDADRARIITAKAKVNKLKTAIVKSPDKYKVPREMKHTRVDSDGPLVNKVPFGEEDRETKQQGMDRIMRDSSYDVKNKKVRPPTPTQADRKRIITAQEHHHKISFRGHKIGGFKGASLNGQSGKYAKYWLLNAKETNGNGWGIAAHTAKENMKKFIGRPLVVTAQSWHGASEYGDEYEHPYLPTNDINAILNHQEKFRVGSIVDVFEDKHGDWYASIEMLPKFASSRLPPFCSPAIYQLDASEAEGQISKWEALHLAALTENPAYGARIALLKGTCVGTDNECKVQFKSAKQESGIECPVKEKQKKVKSKLSKLKKKQKVSKLKSRLAFEDSSGSNEGDIVPKEPYKLHSRSKEIEEHGLKTIGESDNFNGGHFLTTDGRLIGNGKLEHRDMSDSILKTFDDKDYDDMAINPEDYISFRNDMRELLRNTGMARVSTGLPDDGSISGYQQGIYIDTSHPLSKKQRSRITQYLEDNNVSPDNVFIDDYTNTQSIRKQLRLGKLKLKLANLGEQNMTYQESKKIKIHKKKHPEVRKAQSSVEDILRSKGRSVDGSHAQSTFLSSEGDFIGGGDKTEAHRSQVGLTDDNQLTNFQKETGLIRVQNFPINRAGDKKTSLGINSKVNKNQLKSIKDLETGGQTIGFSVGDLGKETTGKGYRDLTKALRERKFLG